MAAATCTELEEDQTEDQTAEAQTEDQTLSTSGDEQYLEKVTMKSSENKTCDESKEVIASDDEELERLALEAILKKAKQDKLRADREGPCGWVAPLRPRPNKRFASSLIASAVINNKKMRYSTDTAGHRDRRREKR